LQRRPGVTSKVCAFDAEKLRPPPPKGAPAFGVSEMTNDPNADLPTTICTVVATAALGPVVGPHVGKVGGHFLKWLMS